MDGVATHYSSGRWRVLLDGFREVRGTDDCRIQQVFLYVSNAELNGRCGVFHSVEGWVMLDSLVKRSYFSDILHDNKLEYVL